MREMTTSRRDGIALRYEIARGPLAPMVFVHGWCCDHTYFLPQFDYFAGRGHTVVAVDLRGHGQSDAPQHDYSMRVFADDLTWLATELELEHPVFVGHSMGGVVAFEVAVAYPTLPGSIVMIDSPVTRPAASRAALPAFLKALEGPEYRTVLSRYVEKALFLPTDDPERRAHILARMTETPRHAMVASLRGMSEFDPNAAAGRMTVPSLYIAANDRPLSDLPRLLELVPQMRFGQTVGSGHFCQLEVPEQVNAMIARFLDLQGKA
jgi:pimeloyl-ACP methyl ester carboxylesterase